MGRASLFRASASASRRHFRIWLDPLSVVVACTVCLLLGVALSHLGLDEERHGASRASFQAREFSRQLEQLFDEQFQDVQRLASLAQTASVQGRLTRSPAGLQGVLEKRRVVSAFGVRSDCAPQIVKPHEDRRRSAMCSVPLYRAASIWLAQPQGGLLWHWSAEPQAKPVQPPSWVRAAQESQPGQWFFSRLDGQWISKQASGLKVENSSTWWNKAYSRVPRITYNAAPQYRGVFHVTLRTATPDWVVTLDLDHAHVAEVLHQVVNASNELVTPDWDAGNWLEQYYAGNYAYLIDDRSWLLAHPKPWHIVGRGPDGRWVAPIQRKEEEGKGALRLSAATQMPSMGDYYNNVIRWVLREKTPRFLRGDNMQDVPRLVWTQPVFLGSTERNILYVDPGPNGDVEGTPCKPQATCQRVLFGAVVVGIPLGEASIGAFLGTHVGGYLLALPIMLVVLVVLFLIAPFLSDLYIIRSLVRSGGMPDWAMKSRWILSWRIQLLMDRVLRETQYASDGFRALQLGPLTKLLRQLYALDLGLRFLARHAEGSTLALKSMRAAIDGAKSTLRHLLDPTSAPPVRLDLLATVATVKGLDRWQCVIPLSTDARRLYCYVPRPVLVASMTRLLELALELAARHHARVDGQIRVRVQQEGELEAVVHIDMLAIPALSMQEELAVLDEHKITEIKLWGGNLTTSALPDGAGERFSLRLPLAL